MNNIYLIGMPLAGKSTIALAFSKKYGFKFIDADTEVSKVINLETAVKNKTLFRKKERSYYQNINYKQKYILATGGGVVLSNKNFKKFKGIVIYLKDTPRNLKEKNKLFNHQMYLDGVNNLLKKRKNLYLKFCDAVIAIKNKAINEIVEEIYEKYQSFNN